MYYWAHDPVVGTAQWLLPVVNPVMRSPLVYVVTWGALAVEFALGLGIIAPRRWRPGLFAVGIAFHAAIALMLGIVSFSLVMVGALVLYLRPVEQVFRGRRESPLPAAYDGR
jgi:antimicrobial peptide system SdpB family protein